MESALDLYGRCARPRGVAGRALQPVAGLRAQLPRRRAEPRARRAPSASTATSVAELTALQRDQHESFVVDSAARAGAARGSACSRRGGRRARGGAARAAGAGPARPLGARPESASRWPPLIAVGSALGARVRSSRCARAAAGALRPLWPRTRRHDACESCDAALQPAGEDRPRAALRAHRGAAQARAARARIATLASVGVPGAAGSSRAARCSRCSAPCASRSRLAVVGAGRRARSAGRRRRRADRVPGGRRARGARYALVVGPRWPRGGGEP